MPVGVWAGVGALGGLMGGVGGIEEGIVELHIKIEYHLLQSTLENSGQSIADH